VRSARSRPRLRRAAAGAALALTALVAMVGAAPVQARQPEADLQLLSQSPGVDVGGVFAVTLRTEGLPAGAALRVVVHDRVRSRSELAATNEGDGLRGTRHVEALPLATVPTDGAGNPRVVLDLAPTAPAGQVLREPGVYPVAVDAVDGSGRALAGLVTHLVLRPGAAGGAPPLDVAVLARVGAAPQPPDRRPLGVDALANRHELVDALAAVPDVTATLAVSPDTLAGLAASEGEQEAALVESLRAAAASRPTLALPYVRTSPDALADAGLEGELAHQLDRGAAVLRSVLGVAPSEATWLATPDLAGDGLRLLGALGIRRTIVTPEQVERISDGVLSPARPFVVTPPRGRDRRSQGNEDDDEGRTVALDGLMTDDHLGDLLDARGEPALVASRVLADLAMLWFEQPSTPRAVVLPVDATVDGTTVRALLEGLRLADLFRPVPLDDAFATALPLRGTDGATLRRALEPVDVPGIGTSAASDVADLRVLRGSVQRMVGDDAPLLAELDAHLLRASAFGLDGERRALELEAAEAAVEQLAASIETPEQVTITLTAREGTVPLTIRNTTGAPVEVQVRLRSPKLELPGGDTFAMTLTEPTTRLDIAVRTRASGSFPFEIEVTSPDGRVELASTRYSVRSTAVSGVGVVLSAGAGLFLILWWARHWSEARRSAKLVNGPTPERPGG
jgi:hypothetical protein